MKTFCDIILFQSGPKRSYKQLYKLPKISLLSNPDCFIYNSIILYHLIRYKFNKFQFICLLKVDLPGSEMITFICHLVKMTDFSLSDRKLETSQKEVWNRRNPFFFFFPLKLIFLFFLFPGILIQSFDMKEFSGLRFQ